MERRHKQFQRELKQIGRKNQRAEATYFASGKNFDLWKMKMKGLYIVSSALNNGILSTLLYEFGEIENAKIFWHILEIKYSEKGVNTL